MNTKQSFNEQEAMFIAKLILDRLNINIQNSDITINKSKYLQKTLNEIERLDKKQNLLSLPPMSANVLSYLLLYSNSKTILELGTSAGYSGLHLANASTYTGGLVQTIEQSDKKIQLAKNNFLESNLNNKITVIESKISKTLNNWNYEKIDFVFLDADKENYGIYLDKLLPIMNFGGIIVADNINDYGHLMEDFLQKVSGTHLLNSRCDKRVRSTYLAQLDNGLMIIKKIGDANV
jgi:caffeoyl-CoA O-methyltransferase